MLNINLKLSSIDECNSSVLNKIAETKKMNKRKLFSLKSEEVNVQSLVEHTYKPIIDPLIISVLLNL